MNIQNKKLIIVFIVIYFTSYQAAAEESRLPIILETNVYSLINKDILSHVDMNRLDTHGTTDMRFYWSPDERKVLIEASISAYAKGGKAALGGVSALYLADISQINSPKLLRRGEDTNSIADESRSMIDTFHWSPSGKYFSFVERSGGTFRRKFDETWILWIINTSTLDVVSKKDVSDATIGEDFHRGYSWSPVEDKIAYIGFNENKSKDIFVLDVSENSFYETGIKEYIKSFENTVLTWSPDGRKLALAEQTYNAGNYSLLIIDPASRKITNLLSAATIIAPRYAFWSPDSRNILVTEMKPDDKIDVYLVNMENGEHRILTTLNNLASYVIKWSMDGKKILFKTSKGDINQFYSMDIDGSSSPVLIFENSISSESADVSGNFTILTFSSDLYNLNNLVVLENENKPLVINNVSYYYFNYKLDSLLYVSQNNGQNALFRLSPGAGSKQLSILPDVKIFSFSPSGNFIIVDNGSESFEKENSNGTNFTTQKVDNSKGTASKAPGLAFIFAGTSVFVVYYIIKMKRYL
ncbi:MAG: hypothetical protein OIN84_15640 [Candidatus Methanoperedens sp.]|nr:hypothetical protein [Candidatus Methanoperedens sp. BLZ2]KAB2945934.1 MAG: hypothetical protein F9K14_09475 [Candidatus Methanoperedens sp.]MBZ0177488.1 hypothetical protein [Candidatus Methanoperedens nitroreducens]MCX9079396.1 hypothetical protein [Candidatus Methanoperedens sp.]